MACRRRIDGHRSGGRSGIAACSFALRRVLALFAALLVGAAAGVLLWRGITPTVAPPSVQRFTVSIAEAGLTLTNGGVAISPDGQTLIFAARGSDNDAYLYARRLDDWRVKKIEGTKGASAPLFSPNGSWVAFVADGLLKKVPTGEGTPQTICRLGYQGISRGSWSADDVIITSRWPGPPVRVSAKGGEAKALASTIPPGYYLWPHALPGGSALLTLRNGTQPRVLALQAGGQLRPLLDTPATCARHLPTGHLVYEAEGRLRAAPFDPERLKVLGDSRVVIDDIAIAAHAGTAAIDYDVSATGTIAYTAASALKFSLVWSDRAGRRERLALDVRQSRVSIPFLGRPAGNGDRRRGHGDERVGGERRCRTPDAAHLRRVQPVQRVLTRRQMGLSLHRPRRRLVRSFQGAERQERFAGTPARRPGGAEADVRLPGRNTPVQPCPVQQGEPRHSQAHHADERRTPRSRHALRQPTRRGDSRRRSPLTGDGSPTSRTRPVHGRFT